jgi:2-polyprenyl-3-methyl-5-hydroxy-6-metoxy-1,4-benzoquinol methylase
LASTRYTVEIDLEAADTSQALAVLEVPAGSLVLDVGAADGSVARRLVERGCRVVAVEADRKSASAAEQVCELVVVADVETLDLGAALDGLEFDVVLLLDVLEHLRDPLATLRAAVARLKLGGRVIVSVPNVTHAALRLQLLSGRFQYTDTGLLDRTHLHFFDRPALERLLAEAGLTVLDRLRTVSGLTETEIPIDPEAFPAETIALALGDADAETYQFVYVATPGERAGATDAVSLGEALQRRASEAERACAEAANYARSLEERVAELDRERGQLEGLGAQAHERAVSLEAELRERMRELEAMHDELEHAKLDIAVKDAQLVQLHGELAPLHAKLDQLDDLLGYVRRRVVDRIVNRVGAITRRAPVLHRVLKRAKKRLARRPP